MKPVSSIPLLIGLSVVNLASVQANTIDDVLITQSRREYKCITGGMFFGEQPRIEPSIAGSSVTGEYCYVPVSAGKCIAVAPFFNFGGGSGPSGMSECNPKRITETDPATGKQYYRFNGGDSFVIQ